MPAKAWLDGVDALIPPSVLPSEARNLVKSAQQDILADAAWLDLPGFEKELRSAARRGVSSTVTALADESPTDKAKEEASPARRNAPSKNGHDQLIAIVADDEHGIRLDLVTVQTSFRKPLVIEAAAFIKPGEVSSVREQLLARPVKTSSSTNQRRRSTAESATTRARKIRNLST